MAVALITGASRGLGRALARTLAARNWALVLDARGAPDLDTVARELSGWTRVVALAGDVADPQHRAALAAAAVGLGTVGDQQPHLVPAQPAALRRLPGGQFRGQHEPGPRRSDHGASRFAALMRAPPGRRPGTGRWAGRRR